MDSFFFLFIEVYSLIWSTELYESHLNDRFIQIYQALEFLQLVYHL
jgi:hypothetical protein